MRFLKVVTTVIFLFLSQYCFSQDYNKIDCNRTDTISLFAITKIKPELKNGDILSDVVDTIESADYYTEFVWSIIEYIDTVGQQIYFQLLLDQSYFCHDYSIKARNIFAIELSKYDSVFIEGAFTNNIDTLDNIIEDFIINPNNKPELPAKKIKKIKYFDTVLVTNHAFFINSVMVPDSNGICSSWDKLNPLINKIVACYYDLRNDLAEYKFDEPFEKLEFNKKIAILEYYPIRILLFPNREILKIPPPPLKETEDYLIDSIIDIYLDKEIKMLETE
jgi:hypothetical protein